MGGGEEYCKACLAKQREIDRLTEQIKLLRDRLRYQERRAREEGPFGSSTPSSKIPLKANTELSLEDRQARRGGAKPGHVGHGRSTAKESEARAGRRAGGWVRRGDQRSAHKERA